MTTVVNIKKEPFDVYIGRVHSSKQHFGNPFSHLSLPNAIKVAGRDEAVEAYRAWIQGDAHQNVEPERRLWIIDNMHTLKGKTLGCFCKPLACHGDILAAIADVTSS